MAPRPPNEEELRNRFNQLVGTRSGRPSRPKKASSQKGISERRTRANQGAGRKAISTYVSHGGGKVSAATKKDTKRWLGSGSTAVTDPMSGANKAFKTIYDNLTTDLNKQVMDQNAVRTAYASQVLDQQVSPQAPAEPNSVLYQQMIEKGMSPEDAAAFAAPQPSIDEQYLGGNLQKYVVEPLSRPGSAVFEGIRAGMEAEYAAEDRGEGNWGQLASAIPAILGGAKKGITGEAHTGFGQVYELGKEQGNDIVSRGLRNLEEKVPWAEQAIAIGAGVTGEIALDPVGKALGGARTGVIGGVRATPESTRAYVRELANKWAADVEDNIITGAAKPPGGTRTFPSEQAIADNYFDSTMEALDHLTVSVRAGGSRGRFDLGKAKMTAGVAGSHGSHSLLTSMTSLFTDRVQRLVNGLEGRGTKLNGTALDSWAANNPDFTEFLDDLSDELVGLGKLPHGASRDVLADFLNGSDVKTIRRVEQQLVDRKYTPYVTDASDAIAREFRSSYYSAPGIRIGKKIVPIKPVGKAYSVLTAKYMDDIGKNFRYNSVFPASLSLDTTRHRAWGVKETEDFEKELRERGNKVAEVEAEDIQRAIENNEVHLLSPELQIEAKWAQDEFRRQYVDEFTFGARGRKRGKPGVDNSTTPYDPNYAYVSNKGGTVGARTRFKNGRKKAIHENVRAKNNQGAGRFKTVNAKEENLRPVTNIYETLRQRRIKHNRDMIRARFLTDMVDKYGIRTRLNKAGQGYAASRRNLEMVPFEKLPESVRVQLDATGEDMYLPREMAEMVNIFDDITKWHSGEQGRIARSLATVMRQIKRAQTLPWPGFHNKNMIGDVFMGLLDNILPQDYAHVLKKFAAAATGDGTFKILKGDSGLDLTFREMWRKYQKDANSGFISSELGNLEAPVKYKLPARAVGKAGQIAQDISGAREDIGRFTHYTTAYKQEAEAIWKTGERDLAKIDRQASSAALWRVNNYKFDYNALMLWEKKAKTLYFPFYTFMRKAAPTLVQALYQDPRWINIWTRFLYQNSVDEQKTAGGFDGFRVPDDIRDVGYAFIGGEKDNPRYVTNDILPTSVFNAVRTENPHEFFNSILTQMALPMQVAVEQGTGRQTFLDKPLEGQGWTDLDYLMSKVPGTREFDQFFDSDEGWVDKFRTGNFFDPNKSMAERLLSSRIGAGLPIRTMSENQQLYAEQEWQDRLIDDPLQAVNREQDLFYISSQYPVGGEGGSGAKVYAVKNNAVLDSQGNGQVVAQFYTPEEAIQYVKQHLPDSYKKVPTTMDINNQGLPYERPIRE